MAASGNYLYMGIPSEEKYSRIDYDSLISVYPGSTYKIKYSYLTSSDFDGTNTNTKLRIARSNNNHLASLNPSNLAQRSWKDEEFTWTCPSDVNEIIISLCRDGGAGWIEYDNIYMDYA